MKAFLEVLVKEVLLWQYLNVHCTMLYNKVWNKINYTTINPVAGIF